MGQRYGVEFKREAVRLALISGLTRRQVELALFEYINAFYNPRRRHSTLGGKSPLAFEKVAA